MVRDCVASWILLAATVGLLGCPLLLDDTFTTVPASDPSDACIGVECVPHPTNDVGGSSGASAGGRSGSAGAAASGGSGQPPSNGGGGGTSALPDAGSAAGASGSSGAAGAGGTEPEGPACRTLELTSSNYGTSSSCIGIHGSSSIAMDTPTTLALSHEDGDPCFTGTIASSGWGAVYELTFAGDDDGDEVWDADEAGVTGFEFAFRGDDPPPSLRVIYKDPSGTDYCHRINPGSTPVPFSSAHPGCDTSGATVDTDRLVEMILAFTPVGNEPYDVDFCIQIRALD